MTDPRSIVAYAIKKGILIRPEECSACGKRGRIEGHHADYAKPLEVEWLCRSCHVRRHNQGLIRRTVLIPEETRDALRDLAKKGKRPLTWEIRYALEDHVARKRERAPA